MTFYKYLGVQIEARPNAKYYKAYEQVVVKGVSRCRCGCDSAVAFSSLAFDTVWNGVNSSIYVNVADFGDNPGKAGKICSSGRVIYCIFGVVVG